MGSLGSHLNSDGRGMYLIPLGGNPGRPQAGGKFPLASMRRMTDVDPWCLAVPFGQGPLGYPADPNQDSRREQFDNQGRNVAPGLEFFSGRRPVCLRLAGPVGVVREDVPHGWHSFTGTQL